MKKRLFLLFLVLNLFIGLTANVKGQILIGPEALQLEGKTRVEGGVLRMITDGTALSAIGRVEKNFPVPADKAIEISVEVDPVVDENSGAMTDAGLSVAMPDASSNPNRFEEGQNKIYMELTELGDDKARFTITMDGQCISFWNRMRNDYGFPNILDRRPGPYLLKLILIPRGEKTGVRFFVEHGERPLRLFNYEENWFVKEWTLDRPLTQANYIGLYTRQGGKTRADTLFDNLKVREISLEQAESWMASDDFVMENINYNHPDMAAVKAARKRGDMEGAKSLLVEYFRTRESPKGPELDLQMARAIDHGKEGNWREVSDNAINGIYAKRSWFHGWSEPGELARENGLPRWERDPGFLTRHYHWVVMTYAWQRTKDPKYAIRLADELIDYVEQEPTCWFNNPNLGGTLHTLDGSVIAEHMLWTGNIGRRLELTWWQTFEVMRKAPGFRDEAVFAFLDSVIRQCRLLTNHTIFLPWDDSGLHGAMALTKSSILFPMADEAPQWNEVGWDRVNYVVDHQFHEDGSHVSLSTGYNWATIRGIEHFYKYLKDNGAKIPEAMKERVKSMFFHPLALTRPNFGSIDLNDGGWSAVDDPCNNVLKWFPERKDYLFFQTHGKEGEAPDPPSMYFPNAGQYLMRTGWGPNEQYLFFDGGPWGTSHGKFDSMNIYTQYGNTLFLRNAGRGAYSGVGNTIHAGKSLSFNTLSPDWAQQNSIPWHHQEMAIGMNPPERRWVNNKDFAYGEGQYLYGWHKAGVHIKGKQIRQVIFMKGSHPRKEGFYVVLDTVEPEVAREYTWRHPWQIDPGNIQLQDGKSVLAQSAEAKIRILPVDPVGDVKVEIVKGQETPELLGWRIYGETANPFPVPTYSWKADHAFTRAWIIMMQPREGTWPIQSVETLPTEGKDEIAFVLNRTDGGKDFVMRRFPGLDPKTLAGKEIAGDVAVIRKGANGLVQAEMELTGGEETVARSTGIEPAPQKPTLIEQYGLKNGVQIQDSAVVIRNSSFEEPVVAKPVGSVAEWESNSVSGTGTWPFSMAEAEGSPDGRQVVVVHQGGLLAQTLKDGEGRPILIAPGSTIRVSFTNLRHKTLNQVNMGVYLVAGHKDGALLAEPFPFLPDKNKSGEVHYDAHIEPAKGLSKILPVGWEKLPMVLKFVGYADRAVFDNVRVELVTQ